MERAGGEELAPPPKKGQRRNTEQAPHGMALQSPRTALTKGWQ